MLHLSHKSQFSDKFLFKLPKNNFNIMDEKDCIVYIFDLFLKRLFDSWKI